MDELTCRLLPFEIADGPTNMARDEVLLRGAVAGVATLRFYGWSPATVSLGYFQRESVRRADPTLAELPFVRRPSGGGMLVHHYEVTYALALPVGIWQRVREWPGAMHEFIAQAITVFGVEARLFDGAVPNSVESELCFRNLTPGDVLIGGAKVVGSAQRRRHGGLLTHGGILLAQTAFTPALRGIRELTRVDLMAAQVVDAVQQAFSKGTGAVFVKTDLSTHEGNEVADLARTKYSTAAWNCKR